MGNANPAILTPKLTPLDFIWSQLPPAALLSADSGQIGALSSLIPLLPLSPPPLQAKAKAQRRSRQHQLMTGAGLADNLDKLVRLMARLKLPDMAEFFRCACFNLYMVHLHGWCMDGAWMVHGWCFCCKAHFAPSSAQPSVQAPPSWLLSPGCNHLKTTLCCACISPSSYPGRGSRLPPPCSNRLVTT